MPQYSLRADAIDIWKAGVHAVDSSKLVRDVIRVTDDLVEIAGHPWRFGEQGRICVVGAGKAGAGMAAGFEQAMLPEWKSRIFGWVNVPEDCVRDLEMIHLHGARPAGVNEPTAAGVAGTQEILDCISALTPDDLCVVLISGGGSALLPAPMDGITLEDKLQVTRQLMRSGATIQQLNAVRGAISKVKRGGLLRACQAGQLIALMISDVIGDPLKTIASGPTVETVPAPQQALEILREFSQRDERPFPANVVETLEKMVTEAASIPVVKTCYANHIIGNNLTAVAAAARRAAELGYHVLVAESDQAGVAADFGVAFADRCLAAASSSVPNQKVCLISGGEPIVNLAEVDAPQKGGRNQELVLAAAKRLLQQQSQGIAILSGGTDGEDGPTDAAGAIVDDQLLQRVSEAQLEIDDYLSVNNSYPFFEQTDGLLKTGPTHTNVMDLRVGVIQT